MLDFLENKGDCTGCSACLNSCPIGCITMERDSEGFLYPTANDACIKCGRCQRVCPIANKARVQPSEIVQKAYCGITKDKDVWQRSASGGAFTEICRAFGDNETIFCGAAWDGLKVHHICVQGIDNIAPLCKSKYVASSPEKVFSEIKAYLKDGKKVVFCGTPCQIAGLKSFLGKEYDSLLLIDLICHGVGSPKVFEVCMDAIGEQFNAKVTGYEFRTKKRVYVMDHLQKVKTANEQEVILQNDQYIQLFLSQNCLRPSCGGNCQFREQARQGDITIADFKGLTKVFPELLGSKKNYSSIIINSKKGSDVLEKMRTSMELRECTLDAIKEYNPLFYRQTWESEDRDRFFREFKCDSRAAIYKWTEPASVYKESKKRRIFNILPETIRNSIIKIVGGVNEPPFSSCALSKVRIYRQ